MDVRQTLLKEFDAKNQLPDVVRDSLAHVLHAHYARKLGSVLTGTTEVGSKAYKTISLALTGKVLSLTEDTNVVVYDHGGDVNYLRSRRGSRAPSLTRPFW